MKRIIIALLLFVPAAAGASAIDEQTSRLCLQSLARFMQYAQSIYTDAGVSARGDSIGYFKALQAGASSEDGVRTNADLAMVAAYVYEMGRTDDISLPAGITYPQLRHMAIRAFRYALATHRANQLATCTDGKHWGSAPGKHQWESSLWALSVAIAADFIDRGWGLTTYDQQQLEKLLASEADFQTGRPVPTGFKGDTKAEENGWEANVLAAATAFCTTHPNATQWREAMLRFGLNCYTVAADAKLRTVVAGRPVSDWYAGANLFPDFTLQNHGFFHASYQNVVMQEQAESLVALALGMESLEQGMRSRDWRNACEALSWHWGEVWHRVLTQLALCDGEMAMPNGNDWSMFLFDHLPAYAAMATLGRNADALLLEQRCLRSLLDRQLTTHDGAFMRNADIGPRRMGVTAHRVMMTALMHQLFTTNGVAPSTWESFQKRHATARVFEHQHLVRSMTAERFACFSWSEGRKSCAAIIVPNRVDHSKIFIPYKSGFGGNVMGTPEAMPARPTLLADSTEWIAFARGRHGYCIWATPGNAVIAIGDPKQHDFGTMAVSMDAMTAERRTLYYHGGKKYPTDGKQKVSIHSQWVNVDNAMAIVMPENGRFSFGGRQLVNSVGTATLTPESSVCAYFSSVTAEQTALIAQHTEAWTQNGWLAVLTRDPGGQTYLLAFNPGGARKRFKMPARLKKMKTLKKMIIDT